MNLSQRFDAKVKKVGECWLWTGATTSRGYGVFRFGPGELRLAHRVAYERERGPIPPGLTLDHFRLNPGPRNAPCSRSCINPEHLEPITQRNNVLRGHHFRRPPQTHCKRGHPLVARPLGHEGLRLRCLACHLVHNATYLAKQNVISSLGGN